MLYGAPDPWHTLLYPSGGFCVEGCDDHDARHLHFGEKPPLQIKNLIVFPMLSHPRRASLPRNSAWLASDCSIEMLEENGEAIDELPSYDAFEPAPDDFYNPLTLPQNR